MLFCVFYFLAHARYGHISTSGLKSDVTMDFKTSWPKMGYWGKMGKNVVQCWPQGTHFYFGGGFLRPCQFW